MRVGRREAKMENDRKVAFILSGRTTSHETRDHSHVHKPNTHGSDSILPIHFCDFTFSFGRKPALSMGPLREWPCLGNRVKTGGCECPAVSQPVCNQILQFFFVKN